MLVRISTAISARGVDTAREYESGSARQIARLRRLREREVFEDVNKARGCAVATRTLSAADQHQFFVSRGIADVPTETFSTIPLSVYSRTVIVTSSTTSFHWRFEQRLAVSVHAGADHQAIDKQSFGGFNFSPSSTGCVPLNEISDKTTCANWVFAVVTV